MKLKYSLLVVAPVSERAPDDLPAFTCNNLIALCESKAVRVVVGKGRKRLPALGRGGPRIVFIAGAVSTSRLLEVVQQVFDRGMKPIVVVDALQVDSLDVTAGRKAG